MTLPPALPTDRSPLHDDGRAPATANPAKVGDPARQLPGGSGEYLSSPAIAAPADLQEAPRTLSEGERRLVLEQFNDTAAPYPDHLCVHQLFEQQAARTPDAVALVYQDHTLSYAELNRRANRLAHHLLQLGVRPEARIALCLERSLELVVALLAVLKAGAAYVPLDPDYPAERLAYLFDDCAPSLLLSQRHLLPRLTALGGSTPLLVDADAAVWADRPDIDPSVPGLTSRHLAYVIYTSGSTGRPKGVMNEHHAVVNRLTWGQRTYPLDARDAVLQKTPFSFDVSVWEFFWPLLAGASLVLAKPGGHRDPAYLAQLIRRRRITTAHFVPPMLQQFLEHPEAGQCHSLRHIICSGEALPATLALRCQTRLPKAALHNLYGPTEAAIEVTAWTCGPQTLEAPVPIGFPIANTRLYLLDTLHRPVPVGVPGELYIGGVPVARGYLNRPELTAERFLPDPFSANPADRLYKTGDLARWRPDGALEFLGRNDHQVKIRGFRIELGEIEACLAGCPAVRDAVVLAREDLPGDRRLVAYYLPATADAGPELLRAHLAAALPEYMLPAAYVALDAFPLTVNGKLDRQALPAPGYQTSSEDYVAPRTPLEQTLADIFASVLAVDRVGVSDNFFELGGHSISAAQCLTRIRQAVGVELPLAEMFGKPSVAALQAAIEARRGESPRIPPLVPQPRSGPLPLSSVQRRLWFLDRLDDGAGATYNTPDVVRLKGALDIAALSAAVDEVIRRHEVLRTRFAMEGDTVVQVIDPPAPLPLPLTEVAGQAEAERLLSAATMQPFSLANEWPMRVQLLKLAADEHWLVIIYHHVATDGWSMEILARELSVLYNAGGGRSQIRPLPELAVQYADYSVWERDWLDEATLARPLAYWRTKLQDAPVLALPGDRPRPAMPSYRGGLVPVHLDMALTGALERLSRAHGVTLAMTLTAAFAALLGRLSTQDEVVLGIPMANRGHVETEQMIGCFVNSLALRVDLRGDPDVAQLLARVRDLALEAYAHQDAPFDRVVEAVAPERSPSYAPLFQAMITLQNQPAEKFALDGLEAERLAPRALAAKFDLALVLTREAGGLTGRLEYAVDLFDAATADRIASHFSILLAALVARPERPIAALPLMNEAEYHQVVAGFNQTRADYPAGRCIHQWFEIWAHRTPDAIAVEFQGEALSYGALNRRANRLARHLQAIGVGPETLVAVCLERSTELIVGLLATLKAGGAYLPLDPQYPAERLAFMLRDAAPKALLVDPATAPALSVTGVDLPMLDLATDTARWQSQSDDDLDLHIPGLGPQSLAYVIYTSGSTGQPKGVMVEHRSLANLIHWHCTTFNLHHAQRASSVAGLGFDAAVWEIWPALCAGATLVLPSPGCTRDPAALLAWWQETALDLSFLPTPLAEFAFQRGILNRSLRTLLVGGDRLHALPAETLPFAVVNNYGPTEATVVATSGQVEASGATPHIGRPIANTRIHLLDRLGQPVPVGVPGEIHIGGAGVARGYLNRPELTAERFLPDPFSPDPDARLYQTGDLARWRPDGTIEFLGRNDHQVKIRGFRIELGEIESCLAACPGVREAVILAREDQHGDPQLVAYYTADEDGQKGSATSLRDRLLSTLPDYMVPTAFVALDAWPLTPNGKIDRQALPPANAQTPVAAAATTATPTEQALAGLVAEVLKAGPVSPRDDFFELGGHSLLAAQLVMKIRRTLKVPLQVRELLDKPLIAELAAYIDALAAPVEPPEQPVDAVPRIPVRPRGGPLPASFAQERLWFIDQLETQGSARHSAAYLIPLALRLQGPLARDCLHRALQTLVERHETLRTSLLNADGKALQRIAEGFQLPLPLVDLSGLAEAERAAALRRRLQDNTTQGFDLGAETLFRATLLRLGEDEHVLLINMHHCISDGWSMEIFVRELSALYAAYRNGDANPLPPLPVQYADFAAWQRDQAGTAAMAGQLAYWRERLSGLPPLLALPTDRPRPAVQSFAGAFLPLRLSPELTEAAKALAQQQGVTLFMMLAAVLSVLLSRHANQRDIVFGSPIANRSHPDVEGLIGFFANTLVIRTHLDGVRSFAELLQQTKQTCLDAYANQDVPFEQVVSELNPERSLAYSPLFQVNFALNNSIVDQLSLPGLALSEIEVERPVSKFDLTLLLAEQGGALSGGFEYSTDLFDASTIARMAGHFEALLAAFTADPAQPWTSAPMLSTAERRQVLEEFQGTGTAYPESLDLHEFFEAQVRQSPGATALEFGDLRLTYAELNRAANRLAHRLRSLGIGPGTLVGVSLERGVELITALLAVIKAGAAYVPIDPAYPADRIKFMVEDARVALLITQHHLRTQLPADEVPILYLDRDHSPAEQSCDGNLSNLAKADDLAYVMYTSGSTGRPKSVAMPRRALRNFLNWQTRRDASLGKLRTVQFASASFDVSFQEIFSTLGVGATLVLIDEETRRDMHALCRVLAEHRIERLFCPAVVLQHLADVITEAPASLREVVASGDQLKITPSVRALFAALPGCRLDNQYGPTESHVVTAHFLPPDPADWPLLPPIGQTLPNTRVYILDPDGRPVPVGVAGELYVAGTQLSRGYLHRPELTAEKFLPDPFSSAPEARMYRTGDLGRWLPDGNIDYQGRADFQVKIRGFRIELGEIESCLAQHPKVQEVLVLAREDQAAGKRLVAYAVPQAGATLDAAELRQHVKASLPDYMVPSAFVMLDALPLGPNRKVDRRALPEPDYLADGAAFVAPRTPTEAALAEIVGGLLGIPRVGMTDDFFELGGHSLLATQLVSRVRRTLQVELSLRDLFSKPIVADLAAHIDALRGVAAAAAPIPAVKRTGPLAASFAQERLWFIDLLETQGSGHLSATYLLPHVLHLQGALARDCLHRALQSLVDRHETLRTSLVEDEGQVLQRIAPQHALDFPFIDLSGLPPDARDRAVHQQLQAHVATGFGLDSPSLFRAALLRLGEAEHLLLTNMHHVISDGWSMEVFNRELGALYAAYVAGKPDPLPPLPIQYADFAAWERGAQRAEVQSRQLAYWKKQLADLPPLHALPTDRPRPAVQTSAGATHVLRLSPELTGRIKALGQRQGSTLFMTLAAAFALLLGRHSNQADVVFGTPIANRTRHDVEGLIGFFVNTLVLRANLQPNASFAELLEHMRHTCLDAYAHQEVPFEQVVGAINPQRNLAYNPLFQIMFVLQNSGSADLTLPGLTLRTVDADWNSAAFDLTLSMAERDGGLHGIFEYNTDLFDADTIIRLAGHFEHLLSSACADPARPICALPMLAESERRQILEQFNDTAAPYPGHLCLHQLFEQQAARTPDAVALVYADHALSYAELNRRANRLAHHLLQRGVQPDQRIALCLERSPELVVALLAVLKAGAAYVPLDPDYPAERLAYLFDDSAPRLLLSQQHLLPRLAALGSDLPLLVDADAAAWADLPDTNPVVPSLTSRHLAYVIYTSGSTGRPKGVMVEHRNVVNLVHHQIRQYGLSAQDRVLQFASFCFDNSVAEIFPALAAGARLVLRPRELKVPDAEFAAFLDTNGITIADLPTAFWHLWAQETRHGRCRPGAALRLVAAGGEKAERRHLDAWLAAPELAGCRWLNTYGPTEATVNATSIGYDRLNGPPEGEVPIGRPIANSRIYVLDPQGAPAAIGVAGELYIGGDGVARGYLNRPELTAERFLPDPFSTNPADRLYKTGDLARWRPDGTLEYLGRNDFQVKLRGFRIELGEIEACLASCPAVRDAVVLLREDLPGDRRLVAYYRPATADTTPEHLRSHLAAALPEHMLPAAYVALDAFPVTVNGKLDRQALPAPDAGAFAARAYAAPQGPVESSLAALWAELLALPRVGRHDNFFELGGHSLLAVSLIARMRRQGLHTDVRALFTAPTLAALAAAVDHRPSLPEIPPPRIPAGARAITPDLLPLVTLTQQEIDSIVATVPGGAANLQDIYPLAPLQEGILFHHLMAQQGDPYLLFSLTAFDSRERLDRYLAALQAVIARHDILRTSFVWQGLTEPVQVVWRHAPLAITEIACDPALGDAAGQLQARLDPQHHRLDLQQAPLLQVCLTHDREHDRWLLLQVHHHLIDDNTTIRLIYDEIAAHLLDQAGRLPVPVPFRNLVAQARLGTSRAEHEAFFRRLLGDVDEPTAPFGLLNVQGDGSDVLEARHLVQPALARRLRDHARRLGVSTATICHLAWALVLARASGRDDVVFGTVLFGRMHGGEGADQMAGLFINTLPIRIRVDDTGVEAGVRQIHTLLADLLRHEHASLALAQRCSAVAAPTPLFSAFLNYRHIADDGQAAPESRDAWAGIEHLEGKGRTNYPLALSVEDLGQDFSLMVQSVETVDPRRVCDLMHTALERLDAALQSAPDAPLHALDVLPPAEWRRVVQEFNSNTADGRACCLQQLFEAQVARTPHALAVAFDGEALAYDALNRRANQLAHRLLALGIKPDDRVALHVERGLDLVVGVLGILKAGAAYVPLDPNYPADRLEYMVADGEPRVLLTQAALQGRWSTLHGRSLDLPIVVLDAGPEVSALARCPDHNPDAAALGLNGSQVAYVTYTSGSTGLPKAVLNPHGGLCNLATTTIRLFDVGPESRFLQFSSCSFDSFIWELSMALCSGASLHLAPRERLLPGEPLLQVLRRRGITHAVLPPSALAALPLNAQLDHLHTLISGSEVLPAPLARHWAQRHRLFNTYGPTETATITTTYLCSPEQQGVVPLGRPIANTRIHILDARQRPVPVGVAGEIHIGGKQVSRGYWNRPELTAERFIPDPFSPEPDARLYKTGDMGRWLPDGNVEFLGRNDFQLKLRGFRVEPGEIEAQLTAYPGVREAVVVAREDQPGDKRLVAYLLMREGETLSVPDLRAALAAKLTDFMVPSAFVVLPAFPRTPNGKLDRSALPAPDAAALAARAYAAPQGDKETAIAAIWQELLGVEQVGRHDHFFELGGHSLLAVPLIERMRRQGLHADIRVLFTAPTLAELAAAAGDRPHAVAVPANLIPVPATPERKPASFLKL